jgi:Phosphoribosylaminoimidazole (AIR) synthetase
MGLVEEQGVKSEEMYKTFNMGVGFCVVAPKDQATRIKSIFKKIKFQVRKLVRLFQRKEFL